LVLFLLALLASLSPFSASLERRYYDMLAGVNDRPARSDIVLIDTRSLTPPGQTAWESELFPDLLRAVNAANARLVLPVEPVPADLTFPDTEQLAKLAEMEQRRRIGAAPRADGEPDTFARQLTVIRQRSELHEKTVLATANMHNLLTAVALSESGRGAAPSSSCATHQLLDAKDTAVPAGIRIRRVRSVATLPDRLCKTSLPPGHSEFWPDEDGIVRRSDLLVNASGSLVPSTAFRATLLLTLPAETPVISTEAISWGSRRVGITDGTRVLLRYYAGRQAAKAFETITAEELLAGGEARARLDGRIVILGPSELRDGETGYTTPVSSGVTAAYLTATAISNLLDGEYLTRPGWSPIAEAALLIIIGLAALAWGSRVPVALSLMGGLSLAVLLLVVEAYLFISQGTWMELATAATYAVASAAALLPLRSNQARPLHEGPARASPAARPAQVARPDDELDLAFSMLRHQASSEHVKQRLYDLALEHARRRDLAKAERVLRHLVGVDPHYRSARDKLQKLAGLRQSVKPRMSPSAAQPPTLDPQDALAGSDLSGQRIGRYKIDQPIGRGAMATVYLGHDPKINRRVAIKTIALAEEFGDSELANARAQFLREAESAGRLNHPEIISIYDAGEDESVAYLAMEYFPGKPLSYYAQQTQLLPPRKALEIMARAADALHYAHSQHVVHRDIKPANLLYDIDTDTLKITDFGIARLTDASRTKTGIILGTPSYMSPEQLAGLSVTGQSDLFSLGITLYQLLAGAPPFRADSIPKLMQKIAHERHPPICTLRPELPPAIDDLLDKALAKEPTARFANGRAMALALRDCCHALDRAAAVA